LLLTSLFSGAAQANAELDRQYALETVGFLKSYDNVDNLFADYVADAYRDYFSKQSRFVLQDLSKVDTVLTHSKVPYQKLIDDPQILSQVARTTRSQTIIRTKVEKEGPEYRFNLEWLHAPHMDRIASESFVMSEPRDGTAIGVGELKAQIGNALDRMVAKVPFKGMITGRDNNSVTLDIGQNAGLRAGDTLTIATLDEVKKHPLLKEIVEWVMTETGKVQIESVEDRIAFGRVISEEPGHQIARYQKVKQIITAQTTPEPKVINETPEANHSNEPPRLGFINGGLWIGGLSRDYSVTNNGANDGQTGGGIFGGAKAEGELWFNREFFADMGFGYGVFHYSQTDTVSNQSTPAGGVGGHVSTFLLDFGYDYLVTGDFFGPKGWAKLGYHSVSYNFPISLGSPENTNPIGFHGLFLGLGGELPLTDQWGAILNLNFGVFTGASEDTAFLGSISGTSDVDFFIGGYYRLDPRITIRAGFDIQANGADGTSSTYGNSSVSQKVISFVPSLVYYF
jgi:hypothetical protein